jgi:hypothetical protein
VRRRGFDQSVDCRRAGVSDVMEGLETVDRSLLRNLMRDSWLKVETHRFILLVTHRLDFCVFGLGCCNCFSVVLRSLPVVQLVDLIGGVDDDEE